MGGAWKVAYADFVTAMMAFFLLLWILNMAPPETKAGLAAYFSGESTMDTSSTSPISNNPFIQNTDKLDLRNSKSEAEKTHYALAEKIKKMLMADAVPQNASGVTSDDVGVQLRVHSGLMFKEGSAELSEKGLDVLEDVIFLLSEYNMYLVVRGHADSTEDVGTYPSPWELSASRSAAVIRFLIEHGVKPSRLRAVAYGDTRPYQPGTSEESKMLNRRVELFFHRPEVMSYSVVY